jgi:hypothetical protein
MSNISKNLKLFVATKIIPFLQNHHPTDIFLDEGLYIEYCQNYKYPLNTRDDKASPLYRKILAHLGKIKSRNCQALTQTKEIKNKVLVQKIKSTKVKKDVFNQELKDTPASITIKETQIESQYRSIKKVQFSSPLTKYTLEKLELQMKKINQIVKDYCYYLDGGTAVTEEVFVEVVENGKKQVKKTTRPRYQFPSLSLRAKFQTELQEVIEDPSLFASKKQTLENLKTQYDMAMKMDQLPLTFMNMVADGGFNMQKELQGAILNDKAMIENGIVELESEVKVSDDNAIPQSIKEIFEATDNDTIGNIEEK